MPLIEKTELIETEADINIKSCLDEYQNFSVIAGAGSGKTTSLVTALDYIRQKEGRALRRDGKRIACITFTNRAVDVITSRLGWDDLYLVSTLHRFLWGEIKRFSLDIRDCLIDTIIPRHIEYQKEKDNGGKSKAAIAARERVEALEEELRLVKEVVKFTYDDTSNYSNYLEGRLSHDDVVTISGMLIQNKDALKKIIGQKYPYIFIDEAQDTFDEIVSALNSICEQEGLPIVGYFGDPMQQIYDKRAGNFHGPDGSMPIYKTENFRCSPEVITLLNAFRKDVEQYPAGENAKIPGSVELILVTSEEPQAPRNRYTDEQLERASEKFNTMLESWGWNDRSDVKLLFLVRQMIARRLGFLGLHRLFNGEYASSRAKDDYESGEHALLKPFIRSICPLVESFRDNNSKDVLDILRKYSPTFNPQGDNSNRTVREMFELAARYARELSDMWETENLGNILRYIYQNSLYKFSDFMIDELDRDPMGIAYDKEKHSQEKGRWLADEFFNMRTSELENFIEFLNDNTPFSTQHGVKGEEYPNVCVVFDDTEAAWSLYSFAKTLTPNTSGEGTEGQIERSRKLAYVCFSRAEVNLKVVLFTTNPENARAELLEAGLFSEEQISIESLNVK